MTKAKQGNSSDLINNALAEAFIALVKNPAVHEKLLNAPVAVRAWAADLRVKHSKGEGRRVPNPLDRFGQKGMERRIAGLRASVEHALPADDVVGRQQLLEIIGKLDNAVHVAGALPLLKRKKAHSRLDTQLDKMEHALVDAVLPKD